jgi:translation initiation factor eIF-2B subunit alpha
MEFFKALIKDETVSDYSVSQPIAVFKAMLIWTEESDASTMSEYMLKFKDEKLKILQNYKEIGVVAGTEMFTRFITKPHLNSVANDFSDWKKVVVEDGNSILDKFSSFRMQAASTGVKFLKDGMVILVHSYSRVVMALLKEAWKNHIRFKVIVTECFIPYDGKRIVKALRDAGISCVLIPDAAVGFNMDKVDAVFVGAEGVVQNGGIINQIGTYQIAVMASYANVPLYVVAESFKFVHRFPLYQSDLPNKDYELKFLEEPDVEIEVCALS